MEEKQKKLKKMECSVYIKASFHDQSYVISTWLVSNPRPVHSFTFKTIFAEDQSQPFQKRRQKDKTQKIKNTGKKNLKKRKNVKKKIK